MSEMETAYTYLMLNRMSYSGIVKGGCLSDPLSRWNSLTLLNRLSAIHSHSSQIHVTDMDAEDFISEYYWMKNNTMFIDPPYFSERAKKLYNCYYTEKQHESLSRLLNDLYRSFPCADMIVTYDFCRQAQQLYPLCKKQVIGRKYSI